MMDASTLFFGQQRRGSSHIFGFPASPNLYTFKWYPPIDIAITALYFTASASYAVTKNGMTSASGILADSSGNALSQPYEVPAGQIIFVGIPAANTLIRGIYVPVTRGEIVYVSKNQAASEQMQIWFDLT